MLNWCVANNIPIRTYSEWADILYNQTPDPYENIFPPLNVDLDNNGVPDGYTEEIDGILDKNDGSTDISNYCYKILSEGKIVDLAGIEKGENEFEIWTKGSSGNFVEVDFSIGANHSIFKFPAGTSEWTKYNLNQSINGNTTLNIPENVSLIDITIRCSDFSSGTVKISGMSLAKSLHENDYLNVSPDSILVNSNSGTVDITIQSKSNWEIHTTSNWVHSSFSDGKLIELI